MESTAPYSRSTTPRGDGDEAENGWTRLGGRVRQRRGGSEPNPHRRGRKSSSESTWLATRGKHDENEPAIRDSEDEQETGQVQMPRPSILTLKSSAVTARRRRGHRYWWIWRQYRRYRAQVTYFIDNSTSRSRLVLLWSLWLLDMLWVLLYFAETWIVPDNGEDGQSFTRFMWLFTDENCEPEDYRKPVFYITLSVLSVFDVFMIMFKLLYSGNRVKTSNRLPSLFINICIVVLTAGPYWAALVVFLPSGNIDGLRCIVPMGFLRIWNSKNMIQLALPRHVSIKTKLLLALYVLLSTIVTGIAVFQWAYNAFENEPGTEPPLLGGFDTTYFMLVTISTVGYGDITPGNDVARAIVMLVILCLFVLLPGLINDIVELMAIRRRLESRYRKPWGGRDKAHIVLCGKVSFKELQNFATVYASTGLGRGQATHVARYGRASVNRPVVILSELPATAEMVELLKALPWGALYLEGSVFSPRDLRRAALDKAHACFVLPERNEDGDIVDDGGSGPASSADASCGTGLSSMPPRSVYGNCDDSDSKEAGQKMEKQAGVESFGGSSSSLAFLDQVNILRAWAIKAFAPDCRVYLNFFRGENIWRVTRLFPNEVIDSLSEWRYLMLAAHCECPGVTTLVANLISGRALPRKFFETAAERVRRRLRLERGRERRRRRRRDIRRQKARTRLRMLRELREELDELGDCASPVSIPSQSQPASHLSVVVDLPEGGLAESAPAAPPTSSASSYSQAEARRRTARDAGAQALPSTSSLSALVAPPSFTTGVEREMGASTPAQLQAVGRRLFSAEERKRLQLEEQRLAKRVLAESKDGWKDVLIRTRARTWEREWMFEYVDGMEAGLFHAVLDSHSKVLGTDFVELAMDMFSRFDVSLFGVLSHTSRAILLSPGRGYCMASGDQLFLIARSFYDFDRALEEYSLYPYSVISEEGEDLEDILSRANLRKTKKPRQGDKSKPNRNRETFRRTRASSERQYKGSEERSREGPASLAEQERLADQLVKKEAARGGWNMLNARAFPLRQGRRASLCGSGLGSDTDEEIDLHAGRVLRGSGAGDEDRGSRARLSDGDRRDSWQTDGGGSAARGIGGSESGGRGFRIGHSGRSSRASKSSLMSRSLSCPQVDNSLLVYDHGEGEVVVAPLNLAERVGEVEEDLVNPSLRFFLLRQGKRQEECLRRDASGLEGHVIVTSEGGILNPFSMIARFRLASGIPEEEWEQRQWHQRVQRMEEQRRRAELEEETAGGRTNEDRQSNSSRRGSDVLEDSKQRRPEYSGASSSASMISRSDSQRLTSIVFLVDKLMSNDSWESINRFPNVWIVLGRGFEAQDLIRAGVMTARCLIIISGKAQNAIGTDGGDVTESGGVVTSDHSVAEANVKADTAAIFTTHVATILKHERATLAYRQLGRLREAEREAEYTTKNVQNSGDGTADDAGQGKGSELGHGGHGTSDTKRGRESSNPQDESNNKDSSGPSSPPVLSNTASSMSNDSQESESSSTSGPHREARKYPPNEPINSSRSRSGTKAVGIQPLEIITEVGQSANFKFLVRQTQSRQERQQLQTRRLLERRKRALREGASGTKGESVAQHGRRKQSMGRLATPRRPSSFSRFWSWRTFRSSQSECSPSPARGVSMPRMGETRNLSPVESASVDLWEDDLESSTDEDESDDDEEIDFGHYFDVSGTFLLSYAYLRVFANGGAWSSELAQHILYFSYYDPWAVPLFHQILGVTDGRSGRLTPLRVTFDLIRVCFDDELERDRDPITGSFTMGKRSPVPTGSTLAWPEPSKVRVDEKQQFEVVAVDQETVDEQARKEEEASENADSSKTQTDLEGDNTSKEDESETGKQPKLVEEILSIEEARHSEGGTRHQQHNVPPDEHDAQNHECPQASPDGQRERRKGRSRAWDWGVRYKDLAERLLDRFEIVCIGIRRNAFLLSPHGERARDIFESDLNHSEAPFSAEKYRHIHRHQIPRLPYVVTHPRHGTTVMVGDDLYVVGNTKALERGR